MRRSLRNSTNRISFFAFQDIITGTVGFVIVITLFLALNLDEAIIGISTDADAPTKTKSELDKILAQVAAQKEQTSLMQGRVKAKENEGTVRREIQQLKALVADLSKTTLAAQVAGLQNGPVVTREQRIEKELLLTALARLNALKREVEAKLALGTQQMQRLEGEVKNAEAAIQKQRDRKNVLRLIPEKSDTSKEPILVLVQETKISIQSFDGNRNKMVNSSHEFLQYLTSLSSINQYVVFYFKPSGAAMFNELLDQTRLKGFEIGYDAIPEDIELEFSNGDKTKP